MRPLLDDKQYNRMETLAKEFQDRTAPRLQKYLVLKSWWATNYVSSPRLPSPHFMSWLQPPCPPCSPKLPPSHR